MDKSLGTVWEYKFAFLPEVCQITGNTIWLKYGYRGRSYYRSGDLTIDFDERWHDKHQHMIWLLRS